ncbi:MAG: DNA-processing protein DprA [Desulfobacterales bacterium]|nr:DNA-processing protein DprA [Desulfobacterales bacterium]
MQAGPTPLEASRDDLAAWFRLRSVTGIGNLLFRRLIRQFETPEAVFASGDKALLAVEGVSTRVVAALRRSRPHCDTVRRELDRTRRLGIRIITQRDPAYPALLLEIPDPPPFLYVRGDLTRCRCPVAIVGSRHATPYGRKTTKRLSRDLAGHGITVVSGMARGIDTAAHEGVIAAEGVTVAVLGSGLERVYPRENRKLFERIAESGAVISEFPLAAEPEAHHFPQRNRIISGMSAGTVVVEATRRSGSLITARLAAEQNREVFAVPGSIDSFKSIGTHGLIKSGAKLVTQVGDILEELPAWAWGDGRPSADAVPTGRSASPPLSGDEARVLENLTVYPIHVDDLTRRLKLEPGHLGSILLALELKGVVRQDPGKLFSRIDADPGERAEKSPPG